MARVPLIGGAYEARSIIANAQRCVNLYPERNPKDSPSPITHYPVPGKRKLLQFGSRGGLRGLYTASNGNFYVVVGADVYRVTTPPWAATLLGSIDLAATPVSMKDNKTTLLLVDGSAKGYTINLATDAFAQVVDGTGAFQGADRVDYLDTFLLMNSPPGGHDFIATLSNSVTFDPLYFASKTSEPDPLATLIITHRDIWLIGTKTTEIWYNSGAPTFPFAINPGTMIQHGIAAKYSIASFGSAIFWLGQDDQGRGVVYLGSPSYQAQRISTHAIETAIRQYPTIADAVGFVYEQEGHPFYVLNFPSGDATWVFDLSTELWHQRAWSDPNGQLHRDRAQCHAIAFETNIVGDWENPIIYALDLELYTDAEGAEFQFIRGFPHLYVGEDWQGKLIPSDGKRIQHDQFIADIQCGEGGDSTAVPQVILRWSDDRGKTWGNPVQQDLGPVGNYLAQPSWNRLGIARDRVYELSWTANFKTALNGAFIDMQVLGS